MKHNGARRGANRKSEYHVWQNMKRRCLDPNNKVYGNYGGRGITVCDRWLNDFATFIADMGERPSPQYTLERVDNSLGYSPENCVWATRAEQYRNRRTPRNVIMVEGMPLKQYAKLKGVCYETMYWRYKNKRPLF